jgi:hypothetical protein
MSAWRWKCKPKAPRIVTANLLATWCCYYQLWRGSLNSPDGVQAGKLAEKAAKRAKKQAKAVSDVPVVSVVAGAGRSASSAPLAAQAAALLSASAEQAKAAQKSKRDAQVLDQLPFSGPEA